MSLMAAMALDSVRAARKIFLGECWASCRIVSLPRPLLPPVTRMTLVVKGLMSRDGVKVVVMLKGHMVARPG